MKMQKSQARWGKKVLCVAMAGTMVLSIGSQLPVYAQEDPIAPHVADYGYYVDTYQKNDIEGVKNTLENPANGVLSQMLNYFTPGTEWNNGTILDRDMHVQNITETANIRNNASESQQVKAFYDDVREKNYSMISGLGEYADEFIKGVNAQSYVMREADYNAAKAAGKTEADFGDNTDLWSITVPEDASTNKYTDVHNDAQWADPNGVYGGIVNLVSTLRGGAASTSSAKKYYKYMRPYRWSRLDETLPQVTILDSLRPMENSDPSNDGGYPSGHTNAAYLAAIAMAYSVPEQYSELMLRASELGYDRIVAGMHSCLDVIGGRMTATAIAASNLYDPDKADAKTQGLAAGRLLVGNDSTVEEKSDYESYQQDKATYLYRMTYNLKKDNSDTTKPMVVPKGAEVLLESRYPYLNADEIRYVLYTTGVSSGYSVLDDAEGWGRLNLFEASNGYGAFVTDVTVNMDASKGGLNAADNWKNDISGDGALVKQGTGMLVLSGNNTYAGGTTVEGGTIRADYGTAFGTGDVTNNSTVVENTDDTMTIGGDYIQGDDATLEMTISSADDVLHIAGDASFGGKLVLNLENYQPEKDLDIITCADVVSKFDEIECNAPADFEGKITYTKNGVSISFDDESETPDGGTSDTSTPDSSVPDSSAPDTSTPDSSTPDTGVSDSSNPEGTVSDDHQGSLPQTGDTTGYLPIVAVLVLSLGGSIVALYRKNRLKKSL